MLLFALVALTASLPAFWITVLIAKYGVDVPYADEWTFAPVVQKAYAGTLTFHDLWTQHNEHRYVFPKLLFIALARLAGGDVRAQMLFSVLLATLTSVGLLTILRRTFPSSPLKCLLLLVPINFLLFSPVQAENWTWGFQFVLFLINFLLVGGACIATSNWSLARKFVGCAVIATVATFSFGSGFILWATTFPFALLHEQNARRARVLGWVAGWGVAGLCAVGLYLFDYFRPAHHPSLAASSDPLDYYRYVATFLGAHLAKAARSESLFIPAVIGTILLVAYLVAGWLAVATREIDVRHRLAPWFAIGGFALLSAALAAVARVGFGEQQALDSRYTTFSLCMSIGVIGLAAVAGDIIRASPRSGRGLLNWVARLEGACLAAFAIAFVVSAAWGVRSMQLKHGMLLRGKGALLFGNVLNSGLVYETYLGGNAADVLKFAHIRDQLGLMHPPLFKSADLSRAVIVPQERKRSGALDEIASIDGRCVAEGWAVLRNKRRVADCVVLAYRSVEGTPIAFAVNDEVTDRRDVAQWLKKKNLRLKRTGWRSNFDRTSLPPGEQQISAYALDAESGTLYELGTPKILP